jgi:hypothetical protein
MRLCCPTRIGLPIWGAALAFPERIAPSYFCAMPIDTPVTPNGTRRSDPVLH